MFPSQMLILMSVVGSKGSGQKLPGRPMDIMDEYIDYYCHSLVKLGYLKKPNMMRGYQLTSIGRKVLLDFVRDNEIRAECEIKKLRQLGIKDIRKTDDLRKEALTIK